MNTIEKEIDRSAQSQAHSHKQEGEQARLVQDRLDTVRCTTMVDERASKVEENNTGVSREPETSGTNLSAAVFRCWCLKNI
jgi:hypothetical protein